MNAKNAPRRLLAAALALSLPLAGLGCNGAASEQELLVGEAAAYLTTSEETGDIGQDAVGGAEATSLGAMGAEDATLATQAPADDGNVCDFNARRQQVLDTYDANKNGQLEREELRQLKADLGHADGSHPRMAQPGQRARQWAFWRVRWAFDEDGDRTLSTEERTALVDALQARCERLRAERLAKYDANGDGSLDDAERAAARQARLAAWEAKRQEVLAKYDANGNGTLEDSERLRLREDRIAAAQARRAAVLAQYDTDGDGRLSVEEALPLRKELQRRIIEGSDAH